MHGSLRPARRDSPSVTLTDWAEVRAVKKCYAHCPIWLRQTVGRLAISREYWALSRLASSRHTPGVLARPKSYTILMEYVEGTPLEKVDPDTVDYQELAAESKSLLADLTRAQVVHGDIGHDHWQQMGRESNLIWTPRNELKIIDFAGSMPIRENGVFLLRPLNRICEALHQHDRLLKTKVEHHFGGGAQQPSVARDWPVGLWELLRLLGKL